MKVRGLVLENYRRHRRTEVAFPDGVTAIVGANGAGKSTILEAIAFALYGPKATRTQKALVRTTGAAPDETVAVTLELELGGQALRIRRELRGKSQAPHASLEADGVLLVQPIAGSSDKVTELVERRLGLDRDGFFQTLVAQQGELDRLGRLAPADRRAFILGLLGIDELDRAIERARERRNQIKAQEEAIAPLARDEGAMAKEVADAKARLAAAQGDASAAGQALERAEAALARAQQEAEALRQRQAERERLARELAVARKEAAACRARLDQARLRLAEAEAAVREAERWKAEASRVDACEAAVAEADAHARRGAERDRLKAAVAQQQGRIDDAARRLAALVPPAQPADLAALERAVQEATQAAAHMDAEARSLVKEHAALHERQQRLATLGEAAACPTCEQPLGERGAGLRGRVAGEAAALHGRWQQAQAGLAEARRAEADTAARLRAARAQEASAQRAEQERVRLSDLLGAERARGREAQDALAALGPEPGPAPDLAAVQRALRRAREAREAWVRASALAERRPALAEEEQATARAVVEAEAASDGARRRLEEVPDPTSALVGAQQALVAAQQAAQAARDTLTAARLAASHAERDVADAVRRQQENAALLERLGALRDELRTWTALVGPQREGLLDRFKEHMVSRIGPAISQEAGRLLSAFTGGRYSEVVLDSDYEVWVGDGGTLYEVSRFSGGERDLVHLAIRLAISRFLASRSGGSDLRFLALDEVFASLDGERRGLVLSALHQLTTLYDQVLAITHLESMQEGLDAVLTVSDRDGEAAVTLHG